MRVDVSLPELGCEFVDADDAVKVEVEPEPDGRVFVPLGEELLEVDDDVTDPEADVGVVAPELVPDTPVGKLPVVIVAPLEVAVVVLEFEKVPEADVAGLVVDVSTSVALPLVELRTMDTVVVMATPFVSVPVTVVRIPELGDASLAVVDPEFAVVVLSPGPGRPAREVVVEIVCVAPVLGLPAELPVVRVPVPSEIVEELPLLVGTLAVELGELLLALFGAMVDVDDTKLVALPEGKEKVSGTVNVVVLETDPPEVGDVFGAPDELDAWLLEIELCVVKKMVDVVSQTGTVMLPEIVIILAEPLVPIVALLAVDPQEGLEDVDHDEPDPLEEPVDAVGLLLSGGSVNPG
ncbi:hypothetical protein F5B21DRAFT_520082 [Xylaria acuta]|nr:hypothetical protein F5B21DRAFT_520082 [Xylaria acuta]